MPLFRSIHPEMFYEIGGPKHFVKFPGDTDAQTSLKNSPSHNGFPVNFENFLRDSNWQNNWE